jgi:hypothetical protein
MWYSLNVRFKLYLSSSPPALCVGGIFLSWGTPIPFAHSLVTLSKNVYVRRHFYSCGSISLTRRRNSIVASRRAHAIGTDFSSLSISRAKSTSSCSSSFFIDLTNRLICGDGIVFPTGLSSSNPFSHISATCLPVRLNRIICCTISVCTSGARRRTGRKRNSSMLYRSANSSDSSDKAKRALW